MLTVIERARSAPVLIGGTGGSGTRVIAKVLAEAGIYLGNRNNSFDSIDMNERWFGELLPYWGKSVPADVQQSVFTGLDNSLVKHLCTMPSDSVGWGWKLPPHVFFTPFFYQVWPGLKVIHLVRDGRDMAISGNQNQLKYLGPVALSNKELGHDKIKQSALLWQKLNISLYHFASQTMAGRYLCIRYEDLCAKPLETLQTVIDFMNIKGEAKNYCHFVQEPKQIARWKLLDGEEKVALTHLISRGLACFGYPLDTEWL